MKAVEIRREKQRATDRTRTATFQPCGMRSPAQPVSYAGVK